MADLYRIKDWSEHFEIAQTRKVKGPLKWLPIPTKHDGKSFRRLMRLPDGLAIFGAWVLILEVAAKCRQDGALMDLDGPLSVQDLADKTGAPVAPLTASLEVLCSQQIGWITRESGSAVGAQREDGVSKVKDEALTEQGEHGGEERTREGAPAPLRGGNADLPVGLNESPAVAAYWRCFRPEQMPTIKNQEAIAITVTDLPRWQATLDFWSQNNYRPESVGKMLEYYREGPQNSRGKRGKPENKNDIYDDRNFW